MDIGLCGAHSPHIGYGVGMADSGVCDPSYRLWGGDIGLHGAHNPIIGYGVWI